MSADGRAASHPLRSRPARGGRRWCKTENVTASSAAPRFGFVSQRALRFHGVARLGVPNSSVGQPRRDVSRGPLGPDFSRKKAMTQSYFETIQAIRYEGPDSKNPLAFRYYDKNRVVLGKSMAEQLRPAVCYWHTFAWPGADV